MGKTRLVELNVGQTFRLYWSNGHGYSEYRVEDYDHDSHVLKHVASYEFDERGNAREVSRG